MKINRGGTDVFCRVALFNSTTTKKQNLPGTVLKLSLSDVQGAEGMCSLIHCGVWPQWSSLSFSSTSEKLIALSAEKNIATKTTKPASVVHVANDSSATVHVSDCVCTLIPNSVIWRPNVCVRTSRLLRLPAESVVYKVQFYMRKAVFVLFVEGQ